VIDRQITYSSDKGVQEVRKVRFTFPNLACALEWAMAGEGIPFRIVDMGPMVGYKET
jgi:hypothetical protein